MDTGVLDFEIAFFKANFFLRFNIMLSFSTCSQSFKKICAWDVLGANVLKTLSAQAAFAKLDVILP